jgi:NADH dehydrogenase FAD-containing subunit
VTGKRVVVIGGGYAGIAAARVLDGATDVTLVNRKESFFHVVAALRAAVDERWTEVPFIPYDRLLRRGRFVRATVTGLDVQERMVFLQDGEPLPFDAVIIATGSDASAPARYAGVTADEATQAMRRHQNDIAAASSIVVVGGGPVGVELAGEIRAIHATTPVTIVESSSALLSGSGSAALGRRAKDLLERQDVVVRLGQRLERTAEVDPGALVLNAAGSLPNTAWMGDEQLTDRGLIRVDEHLRVRGSERVFAIGDAADIRESKLAIPAVAQALVAAANARGVLSGGRPRLRYRRLPLRQMVVPVGPNDGVSLLQGLVVGGAVTRQMKSRDLLVGKTRKALRVVNPGHLESERAL